MPVCKLLFKIKLSFLAQFAHEIPFFRGTQPPKTKEKLVKRNKTRRTQSKNKDNSLTVIGINCNGLSGKRDSMTANIELIEPSAFLIQETKFMKKGLFKVKDYEIFESIRPTGGGSILTGVHSNLSPVMIRDGAKDDVEILVVEGDIENNKCRFINGYGPQESAEVDRRIKFFAFLEEEVIKAKLQGSKICIEMNANAKLGGEIIKNDPHTLSPNGELLLGLVIRNNLVICNATELCEGLITRKRSTVNGTEKNVIDYLIVCEEMFILMFKMTVDEAKKFSVQSYSNSGNISKGTKTDHNMIIGKFHLKVQQKVTQSRREIFKYDDVEGQKQFKELTSHNILSKCFGKGDIVKESEKWLK